MESNASKVKKNPVQNDENNLQRWSNLRLVQPVFYIHFNINVKQ